MSHSRIPSSILPLALILGMLTLPTHTSALPTKRPPYALLTVEPAARVTSTVILLHGTAGHASSNLPFVTLLQRHLPTTRFILPQASSKRLQHEGGETPSWFSYTLQADRTVVPKAAAEVTSAARNIANIIAAQERDGIPSSRVGVIGWSQVGGALALATGLRHRVGACVAVSGELLTDVPYPQRTSEQSRQPKFLLLHGRADVMVSDRVFGDVDRLKKLGRSASMITYENGGHMLMEVWQGVAKDMAAFLKKSLK